MRKNRFSTRLFLAALSVALVTACAAGSAIRDTDPHLVGERNMNYDHLIVPGYRIGPVAMGGYVIDAVQHLGEPDRVHRSTFRGPGYNADEVYYYYRDECIQFVWEDTGVEPRVESGLRGINVFCDKWQTADGLHVGMPIREVIRHLGQYCASNRNDGTLIVSTKEGIWFDAPDRNGAVTRILVMPRQNSWGGMCRD